MSEKSKSPEKSKEKMEHHKKSTNTSRVKKNVAGDSSKNVQKPGTKDDDWNDPTGNSHLSDKS
jgi:hypothetical protein